jgi:aminoglycoside 6'-N-acetyltransferase
MTLPTLRRDEIVLCPAGEDDVAALAAMLREPDVAAWWGAWDEARIRRDMLGPAHGWVIEADGRFAGWAEHYEETDPDYRHVSFDISFTGAFQDRGYGRRVLRLLIEHFAAQGHHRFTIDPSAGNERAIRCYSAVGFKPVGRMRSYERDPAGGWRDGLLMDLLVEELPD